MDVYAYREVLGRIEAAEKQFPGKGVEVSILQALLEQNELLKVIGKKLDYIELCIEDIDEK